MIHENVVLYCSTNGRVAALENFCPHRMLPLSKGKVKGDAVECSYHGTTFNSEGKCIRVPGQDQIPDGITVQSFPVVENLGLVWVWMGDATFADKRKVYDLSHFHDSGWSLVFGDALHLETHYLNLAVNMTDPSHVTYVHLTILGDQTVWSSG